MKYVIGIDPSLTNTAVCCLCEDGTYEFKTYQSPCPELKSVLARIQRFKRHAENIGAGVQAMPSPMLVLLEGYVAGLKVSTTLDLAEFGGLLRQQLRLGGTLAITREVAPATLKQFALGKGVGKKNLIGAHLAHRYGVLLNSDDEYDAFGLVKLGACVVGWDKPANEGQRKAVATIQAMDKTA